MESDNGRNQLRKGQWSRGVTRGGTGVGTSPVGQQEPWKVVASLSEGPKKEDGPLVEGQIGRENLWGEDGLIEERTNEGGWTSGLRPNKKGEPMEENGTSYKRTNGRVLANQDESTGKKGPMKDERVEERLIGNLEVSWNY